MSNSKKILFALVFENYSIIKTYIEEQPFEEIVLFADESNIKKVQQKSIEYIKNLLNKENIKVIELPKYDIEKMIQILDNCIENYPNERLYFDVSHGHKVQAYILILYLMIKNPANFEKMIYYSKDDNSIVDLPIFEVKSLNSIELEILNLCNTNNFKDITEIEKKMSLNSKNTRNEILNALNSLNSQKYIEIKNNIEIKSKGKIYLTIKNLEKYNLN